MCRYVAYTGPAIPLDRLLYRPTNSLIHQASEAMESRTRINADGFGIGWYNPRMSPKPAVFKDVTPAWSNMNLRSMADKIDSGCIFAHVRAARRFDPVSRANCHPFHRGHLLWMHNGDIPHRTRFQRRVLDLAPEAVIARVRGNTDTELAFALFQTLLDAPPDRAPTTRELTEGMTRTVERIFAWWVEDGADRPLALNFCVTNGRAVVAVRYAAGDVEVPSLHYRTGSRYDCSADGVPRIHDEPGEGRCVLVASERLSDDGLWRTAENGSLIVVDDTLVVRVVRLPLLAPNLAP